MSNRYEVLFVNPQDLSDQLEASVQDGCVFVAISPLPARPDLGSRIALSLDTHLVIMERKHPEKV